MSAGKIAQSAANSVKATPRGTHQFAGRTYQNEKDLTHVMDEPVGKVYPGHGWPSLTTIYKIDRWLVAGIRAYTSRPNEAEKQLLIERYGLVWDERKRRYTNSPDNIWQIAKSIYPNKLAEWAIISYGELEYRATHR